jgi:GT2 family glycosyltransferase
MDVSILIISFNTVDMTRICLDSVFDQTTDVSFEVIVVDNASEDGSAEMIRHEFPEVALHALDSNLGFGRANNLAAESAMGDYVLLLNSDTVVLDHAIDRLVEYARGHEDAGVYGGRSIFADGSLNPQCVWGRPTLWSEFCVGVGLSALFPRSRLFNPRYLPGWLRDSPREVDIIAGSFLLMEISIWKRLEGFDPRFFMYGEDIDLCLRARELGHRCLFTHHAEIIHHGGGSERVAADKMIKLLRAKAQLYWKHWSAFSAWLGVRFLDLWVVTRVLGHGVIGRLRKNPSEASDTWTRIWRERTQWHTQR